MAVLGRDRTSDFSKPPLSSLGRLRRGRRRPHMLRNRHYPNLALNGVRHRPIALLRDPRRWNKIGFPPVRTAEQGVFSQPKENKNHGRKRPNEYNSMTCERQFCFRRNRQLGPSSPRIHKSSTGWSPPARGASAMRCFSLPLGGGLRSGRGADAPFLLRSCHNRLETTGETTELGFSLAGLSNESR